MTARAAFLSVALACFVASSPLAAQDDSTAPAKLPELSTVAWAGVAPTLQGLQGKTVVVLNYVTWCPKCNEWTPKMISELKEVVAEKPVVILAICNDEPSAKAVPFIQGKGLDGPNVFHGYSPTLADAMGMKKWLWSYSIIDPSGTPGPVRYCGQYGNHAGKSMHSISSDIANSSNLGELSYVSKEYSPTIAQAAWALEVGQLVTDQDASQVRAKLSADDKAALTALLDKFVEKQATKMKMLSEGSAADKLAAIDAANLLATGFKARPEGKEAKALAAELKKDKEMKLELLARNEYERASNLPNPAQRAQALATLAKKSPNTVYGGKAAAALAAGQSATGAAD